MADTKPAAAPAAPSGEPMGELMKASNVAAPFQASITQAIAARRAGGKRVPKLVGILATPSPPSVAYAEWTKKACEEVGIEFEIWKTWHEDAEMEGAEVDRKPAAEKPASEDAPKPDMDLESDVEDLIIAANADDKIHGIMVYYPIFGGRQDTYLQQIVDPRKDVEGLHFSYCWNMYHNVRWIRPSQLGGAPGTTSEPSPEQLNASPSERRMSLPADELVPRGFAKSILPCTPLAVVKCLEAMGVYDSSLPYGDRLYGKTITVVNRSEVVGRPLAALLSNDGARVFSVDLDSVQEFNKRADNADAGGEDGNGRTRSAAVLAARAANSSRRLRPHHVVRPCGYDLKECVGRSNVVISGVPSPKFQIQTDWVPQGAVTINFSSAKNFEKDVRRRAAKHLPAIGKTTIAMLQRNLLRLVEYRELSEDGRGAGGSGRPGPGGGDGSGPPGDRPDGGLGFPGAGPRGGGDAGHSSGPGAYRPTGGDAGSSGGPTPGAGGGAPTSRGLAEAMPIDGAVADADHPNILPRLGSHRPSDSALIAQRPPSSFANRGRASTLSLPKSDLMTKDMRLMRPPSVSPTYAGSFGHVGPRSISSSSTTSSSVGGTWDWRHGRRDSLASASTSCASPSGTWSGQQLGGGGGGPNPKLYHGQGVTTPQQAGSPLLFAPISPFSTAAAQNLPAAPSTARTLSRPGTPVSPLLIDGLSVEDGAVTSPRRGTLNHPPSSWENQHNAGPHPSVFKRPMKDLPQRYQVRSALASPLERGLTLEDPPQHVASHAAPPQQAPVAAAAAAADVAAVQGFQSQAVLRDPPAPTGGPGSQPERFVHTRRRRRPPYSYSSLIAQAISSTPEGRMTLREIYTWISNAYPELYSMNGAEGQSWQNTVRHNLSLNKSFVKVPRTAQDIYESCASGNPSTSQAARGKGGWWMLDPAVAHAQLGPNLKGGAEEYDAAAAAAAASGDGSSAGLGPDGEVAGRAPRRRRTSSFAPSMQSSDGFLESPLPSPSFPPSVLSPAPRLGPALHGVPAHPYGLVPAHLQGDSGDAPSVLQRRPRTFSTSQPSTGPAPAVADMSSSSTLAPPTANLIRGRTRGYTTGSADPRAKSLHAQPPPYLLHAYQHHSPYLSHQASPGLLHPLGPTSTSMASSHMRTTLPGPNGGTSNSSSSVPSLHPSPSKRKLRFDAEAAATHQALAAAVEARPGGELPSPAAAASASSNAMDVQEDGDTPKGRMAISDLLNS